MTQLATGSNPHFHVSDLEIEREGKSFTIDTLETLSRQAPGTQFFLIIGGDSLEAFHTWRSPEAIIRLAELLVYPRPHTNLGNVATKILQRSTIFDMPQIDVSSSDIRKRLDTGSSVRYLVPASVLSYIREQRLYAE
jgi:nicotinate-nucleotide adenylyltransferase